MFMLSLLFLLVSFTSFGAGKRHKAKKKQGVTKEYTVAAIKPSRDIDTFVRVCFLQSARFYKLSKNADPGYLKLLKESEEKHTPVLVERVKEESDVIVRVSKAK